MSKNRIVITCTEEQESKLKECGCIYSDDDRCDCRSCGSCEFDTDNIEFRRE